MDMSFSPESLMDVASTISRLKMYPYFDACHYVFMCLEVRNDLATGATLFSRKHPLSCWLSCMLMCFAGGIIGSFLLGEPVLSPFKKHDDVVLATLIWYLVFYAPFDVGYKLAKFTPLKVLLAILKETQRAYKVHHGVAHASKLFPSSYLIIVAVGTAKGAGSGLMKTFEQLVRGVWVPTGNEILRPAFATKACVMASIVFMMEKKTDFIDAPHELIYLGVAGFFVYFKLSGILLGIHDPFAPFENFFCAIAMGGIWDALSRAIAASRERRAAAQAEAAAAESKKAE